MSREEAIKELTELLPEEFLSEYTDAIKMGIEALEQEPCGDCISRKAVDRIINKWLSYPDYELKDEIYDMTKKIHKLPSVTPMPKMGKWEWLSYEGIDEGNWHCSECRMIIPRMPIDDDGKPLYKCCPFCGSKNRGEE